MRKSTLKVPLDLKKFDIERFLPAFSFLTLDSKLILHNLC